MSRTIGSSSATRIVSLPRNDGDADELRGAQAVVDGFEAARAQGEERALVDGLWVEVPTYRNACRLIERARRLSGSG